jgi:hypothetical protein
MAEKLNRYAATKANRQLKAPPIQQWKPTRVPPPPMILLRLKCSSSSSSSSSAAPESSSIRSTDELTAKIQSLSQRWFSSLDTIQSDCFWCTCSLPEKQRPYYIPTKLNPDTNEIHGYGYFCCPQCALAWLYEEKIPEHDKHERDQLLHLLFQSPESQGRFRMAPDPRYYLQRFTGTLTPEEFQQCIQSEKYMQPSATYQLIRQQKEIVELQDSTLQRYYQGNTTAKVDVN